MSVAGARREAGVSVAEVNLTHIWDVVSQIHVGRGGRAYVVGGEGRLIAHPDISLVLRNTDLSRARAGPGGARRRHRHPGAEQAMIAFDERGERVLTAYAKASPLDWLVFVEIPESEADEPLYAAITRTAVILAGRPRAGVARGVDSRPQDGGADPHAHRGRRPHRRGHARSSHRDQDRR